MLFRSDTDLDKFLLFDLYPRYSLRDYLLDAKTSMDDFYKGKFTEVAKLADSTYEFTDKIEGNKKIIDFSRKEIIDLCLVKITKTLTIIDNLISVGYSLENFGIKKIDFIFGTEFNLSLYYAELCEAVNEEQSGSEFIINDLWKQIKVEYSIDHETRIWSFPVQTVSDSESGIEKMHQGLCVFFNWPITLAQNGQFKIKLEARLN